MLNCIAIDDEPLALEIIESFCKQVEFLNLQKTFTNTEEAAKYLRKFPCDLLFLDIQMPDKTGIEFYKQDGQDKMVIFTTAYSHYAVEGFNLNALDYLLKPIGMERFLKAANKAKEYFQYIHSSNNKLQDVLYVRSEYSLVKIDIHQIEYIETLDDYLKIHIGENKPVLTKMNLKNMLSKLNANEFIRVHRSYIVPFSKIKSVRGKLIQLQNIELPIGIKFHDDFFQKYGS
jgi:DNA-binding LytR/AlgR family response regulator